MKRPAKPNLIEKALARAEHARWRRGVEEKYRSILSTAEIQALISDDSDNLVNTAGRVLYVVVGAAIAEGVDDADPNLAAVMAACDALYEQAGEPAIEQAYRDSIRTGLGISVQWLEQLEHESVLNAACELELKMRQQTITVQDFLDLRNPLATGDARDVHL